MDCSPLDSLSMGFSRQEYWSGLPFPPPGDLLNLGIEPRSSESPALAGGFFTTEPWKTLCLNHAYCFLYFVFKALSINKSCLALRTCSFSSLGKNVSQNNVSPSLCLFVLLVLFKNLWILCVTFVYYMGYSVGTLGVHISRLLVVSFVGWNSNECWLFYLISPLSSIQMTTFCLQVHF